MGQRAGSTGGFSAGGAPSAGSAIGGGSASGVIVEQYRDVAAEFLASVDRGAASPRVGARGSSEVRARSGSPLAHG